jgi:hypothetical protein
VLQGGVLLQHAQQDAVSDHLDARPAAGARV